MSAWLRKTKGVPGSAPGGYVWNALEDVVEVEDDTLAAELVSILDAGFVTAPAPDVESEPEQDEPEQPEEGSGQPEEGPEQSGAQGAPPKPARRSTASKPAKTPVQE